MGEILRVACLLSLFHVIFSESQLKLPAPTNVRIESYNLKQKLTWDPVPSGDNETVIYIVEHNTLSKSETWTIISCFNNMTTECDFTMAVPLTYRVQLRVQARLGQLVSSWTETSFFEATRDTVVGPVTSLNVTPEHGSLFVSFSAPFQQTQEEWNLGYNICHWKKQTPEDKTCIDTKKTIHTLDLEPWTVYCIEVKPMYLFEKKGNSSGVICKETSASAATRAGYIAIILFSTMSSVFVVGIGCFFLLHKFRKDIKHWLYPPFRIPPHIEEFFLGNYENEFVMRLESEDHEEVCYDKLSFVSTEEII